MHSHNTFKMERQFYILYVLFFYFVSTSSGFAKIKLPAIVSSNMVLQRNTTVTLWGWANAHEAVTISASWLNTPVALKANKTGYWSTEVVTTHSKQTQTISITDSTTTTVLKNILFGEVWLCSGQSNMYQPLKGYPGQPTFGGPEAIIEARNPNLRLFSVHKRGAKSPLKDVKAYTPWQEASSQNTAHFSAVAYFFGQQLQHTLDVPVGIIHSSWGGSTIEAWMSTTALKAHQTIEIPNFDISKIANHTPTALFNAMIHPLLHYNIKGMLWYQGESNREAPNAYMTLFPALVKDWRMRWQLGDFPFYYVQIAPYNYNADAAFQTVENTAFMREAQLKCLDLIPNSGIAITMDIGAKDYIHPPRKKEVAQRLLANALHLTYGYETVDYATPRFKMAERKTNGLVLKFENAAHGLYAPNTLNDFEIAGADKVFYPATAEIINRKQLFVKSPKVKKPVAVRYAWKNWVKGSLFTTGLLPLSSFRTDDWTHATRAKTD